MFAVIAELEKSGRCTVDRKHDSRVDLLCEFRQWLGIAATSQEGPWQRARHFSASIRTGLSDASSDASSAVWAGVVHTAAGTFPAGGAFPPDWLNKHINQKEMYGLYHLLRQLCTRHPDALRRAQVLMDVDNQSVVSAFNRGRARNRETHALLVQLFEPQEKILFHVAVEMDPDG